MQDPTALSVEATLAVSPQDQLQASAQDQLQAFVDRWGLGPDATNVLLSLAADVQASVLEQFHPTNSSGETVQSRADLDREVDGKFILFARGIEKSKQGCWNGKGGKDGKGMKGGKFGKGCGWAGSSGTMLDFEFPDFSSFLEEWVSSKWMQKGKGKGGCGFVSGMDSGMGNGMLPAMQGMDNSMGGCMNNNMGGCMNNTTGGCMNNNMGGCVNNNMGGCMNNNMGGCMGACMGGAMGGGMGGCMGGSMGCMGAGMVGMGAGMNVAAMTSMNVAGMNVGAAPGTGQADFTTALLGHLTTQASQGNPEAAAHLMAAQTIRSSPY